MGVKIYPKMDGFKFLICGRYFSWGGNVLLIALVLLLFLEFSSSVPVRGKLKQDEENEDNEVGEQSYGGHQPSYASYYGGSKSYGSSRSYSYGDSGGYSYPSYGQSYSTHDYHKPHDYSHSPHDYSHPPHDYSHPPHDYSHPPPHDYSHPPPHDYSHPPPHDYSHPPPHDYSHPPPHDYSHQSSHPSHGYGSYSSPHHGGYEAAHYHKKTAGYVGPVKAHLYPIHRPIVAGHAAPYKKLPPVDDVYERIPLQCDYNFMGVLYKEISVSSNGMLSFNGDYMTHYADKLFPLGLGGTFIAPFWSNILTGACEYSYRKCGNTYFYEAVGGKYYDNDRPILERATQEVRTHIPHSLYFHGKCALVVTWKDVIGAHAVYGKPGYGDPYADPGHHTPIYHNSRNTFQAVLVTDYHSTYLITIYYLITWAGSDTVVGIDGGTGHFVNRLGKLGTPISFTKELLYLDELSNVVGPKGYFIDIVSLPNPVRYHPPIPPPPPVLPLDAAAAALPVVDHPLPVGGVPVPGGAPIPVGGAPIPVGSAPIPVGGAPISVGGAPIPVGGAPIPVGGAPIPVGGAPIPVGVGSAPVGSHTAPVVPLPADYQTVVAGQGQQQPVINQQHSVTGGAVAALQPGEVVAGRTSQSNQQQQNTAHVNTGGEVFASGSSQQLTTGTQQGLSNQQGSNVQFAQNQQLVGLNQQQGAGGSAQFSFSNQEPGFGLRNEQQFGQAQEVVAGADGFQLANGQVPFLDGAAQFANTAAGAVPPPVGAGFVDPFAAGGGLPVGAPGALPPVGAPGALPPVGGVPPPPLAGGVLPPHGAPVPPVPYGAPPLPVGIVGPEKVAFVEAGAQVAQSYHNPNLVVHKEKTVEHLHLAKGGYHYKQPHYGYH